MRCEHYGHGLCLVPRVRLLFSVKTRWQGGLEQASQINRSVDGSKKRTRKGKMAIVRSKAVKLAPTRLALGKRSRKGKVAAEKRQQVVVVESKGRKSA